MDDALIWLGLAVLLVILEIFTGTFYLLMIAFGMLAGAAASWLGLSNPLQMLCVALVGIGAVLVLRLRRKQGGAAPAPAADPSVNLDIGQSLRVEHWRGAAPGPYHARVAYRGAQWDIELEKGVPPEAGEFVIREVHGSRLLVSAAN
ncbi:NfeD family protein [Lacisediminimonas sp.]|uniref:NfeD family protein n=1 Tax=Lacisediminimonas sp. TaxID=3060582 RepID=UPI00271C5E44|nr:NfeD family protein [Lacisediminimonas sp.]MDO8299649.1 NfeD family protein [Lacisediminimonas sp.]